MEPKAVLSFSADLFLLRKPSLLSFFQLPIHRARWMRSALSVPAVLPVRIPNLLVNGADGIAVGMTTNIPTHNLGEVIDATVYRLEHKRATVSDMRQFILGPDFPTGGIIDDVDALNNLYETGQGSFYIHCTVDSTSEKGKIILTDIPYGEIKSTLVADLDKRRIESHLDSVVEVRDESTEDIRIVIELKKDANPEPVINFYRNKGALRSTFAANMLAIDKGHPKTMNLLEMIDAYIDHQKEVILRRSKFDFDKKSWRLSIVRGLIKAVSVLDEVIHIIRHSSGKEDSKTASKNETANSDSVATGDPAQAGMLATTMLGGFAGIAASLKMKFRQKEN